MADDAKAAEVLAGLPELGFVGREVCEIDGWDFGHFDVSSFVIGAFLFEFHCVYGRFWSEDKVGPSFCLILLTTRT